MKKINVFLRLSIKSHPLYEELVNFPPQGINYKTDKKIEHYSSKPLMKDKIKNCLWGKFIKYFLSLFPISPNNCDLIHSTNNIIPLSKKPWIIDTESGYGIFGFNYKKAKNPLFKLILRKIFKNKSCKEILAWSKICKKELIELLGKDLENKIKIVYPAHHVPNKNSQKNHSKKIKLLFVSRRFEDKGGYELLEAFNLIKKKFNCKLTLISDIPKEILEKYSKDKKIILKDANLKREEIKKFYEEADIFVYPTRIDTFGFVLIEAMAYKLPIITTRLYALPEIVEENKAGLLINPLIKWENNPRRAFWKTDFDYLKEYQKAYLCKKEKIVKDLATNIEKLCKDKKLREKFGKSGFKAVSQGVFSIKNRNKKLRELYEKALH